jgi:hypothetical protein
MKRSMCLALWASSLALPVFAQSTAPFPTSLEDAAQQFDPTKPASPPDVPAPSPTDSSPPAPTGDSAPVADEAVMVDGWKIVSVTSLRRGPNGAETTALCGYERDVTVAKEGATPAEPTRAVLVVACVESPSGPTPGAPTLRFSADGATPPPQATVADKEDGLVEVAVSDTLNKDLVVAVLQGLRGAITACRTPATAGRISVQLEVGVDGRISNAVAQPGPLQGTAVEACVVSVWKGVLIPRGLEGTPASVTVTWAFVAQPEPPPPVVAVVEPAPPPPVSPVAAPCSPGEKPKPPAALKPGELACIEAVAPVCQPGEMPKAAAALKPGELACVPPQGATAVAQAEPTPPAPLARPCSDGELPKKPEELAVGELACRQLTTERTVPFQKGELSRMGDVQLVNVRSSFGLGLGATAIDTTAFAVLRPDLNMRFSTFQLGLGAPLRFELFSWGNVDLFGNPVNGVFGNFGKFRMQDWDQIEDFLRPIRYVTYGKKEENLYISLNRVNASTIGHGQLVRRYSPNIDIDEDNSFANFDAYGDWGGVELMAGPFPVPRLVGGLAFIKPFGILQDIVPVTDEGSWARMALDSWSIGFSYVTDLNSPTGLEGRTLQSDGRRQLKVDAANQFVWANRRNPVGDVVQGMGIDTEIKLLRLDNVDLKTYADVSALFFPGDSSSAEAFKPFSGAGAAVGSLIRVSLGQKPIRPIEEEEEEVRLGKKPRPMKPAHAFRLRLEGRSFTASYLPSYWNMLYEVDRLQFGADPNRATLPTKIGFLASKQGDPLRVGYYVEASYAWVDALALTAMLEDAYPLGSDTTLRAKNFALHAETAGLGWFQLFATYHYRNFEAGEFNKLFSLATDNEVLFAGVRLQVLPIMFLNVAAQRAFRLGFSDDDAPGDFDKNGYRYTSTGLKNASNIGADIELGWQF